MCVNIKSMCFAYVYVYLCICVCMCVCLCVNACLCLCVNGWVVGLVDVLGIKREGIMYESVRERERERGEIRSKSYG